MGKKNKVGKKSKSGKKKDHRDYTLADLSPALTQAARSMRTVITRSLTASGLYAGQDGVILALAASDGLPAGSLAQKLGVKAPTMTRTIGRMEAQGFVERRPDAEDARLTKVYLTETGRNSVSEIESSAASCDELATRGFSEKDIRSLVRLLKAIESNLQAGDDDEDEDEF
ncbi:MULTISPECIES: MarR family winged helix-turn-helix transcriptional regulator [Rhizobium]|jgi:DNA-binding MarR family transcriptional regulator|uniref:DNA-binding transcriptional regulator, MarR family n=1 Tax=Rhizobium lusitanum TaxID=293958 RepID=A0A1C3UWX5_9HYPH|nr:MULTISPECIES: MarR family winged helix-turn-helix transcriptional regulator [Rhizobium]NRP86825.1 Transcriptional activatory protein BadR [Ensifer adhaerens]NKJ03261.1 DNA-binding MarR family transcriptional regulator [Rhizobium sp. SG741]NKJ33453.1 DNA-binding MarR family transcriptional regulator [Rhizobium sp. SG570]NTJ08327.1 winged helix-turn-helix transcriptional regulator [Rhizobium lusitanum]SCB19955.1 DNA-binding transcriptional regulator, MarR family [Rhizobium lusitanum]